MKICSFNNCKGGIGKTTTAIHVAICMANMGVKVLLVDLDFTGNMTKHFTEFSSAKRYNSDLPSIIDLYAGKRTEDCIIPLGENYGLISADHTIESFSTKPEFSHANDLTYIRKKLEEVDDQYDVCIIDTHPDMSLASLHALHAADYVFPIVTEGDRSLEGLTFVYSQISQIMNYRDIDATNVIGIVAKESGDLYTELCEQIKSYGLNMLCTVRYDVEISKYMESYRLTAYDMKKYGKTSRSFSHATQKIMKEMGIKKGPVLHRLFQNLSDKED